MASSNLLLRGTIGGALVMGWLLLMPSCGKDKSSIGRTGHSLVVAAATDLPVGTRIEASHLTLRRYPLECRRIETPIAREMDSAIGARALYPVQRGDVLTWAHLLIRDAMRFRHQVVRQFRFEGREYYVSSVQKTIDRRLRYYTHVIHHGDDDRPAVRFWFDPEKRTVLKVDFELLDSRLEAAAARRVILGVFFGKHMKHAFVGFVTKVSFAKKGSAARTELALPKPKH